MMMEVITKAEEIVEQRLKTSLEKIVETRSPLYVRKVFESVLYEKILNDGTIRKWDEEAHQFSSTDLFGIIFKAIRQDSNFNNALRSYDHFMDSLLVTQIAPIRLDVDTPESRFCGKTVVINFFNPQLAPPHMNEADPCRKVPFIELNKKKQVNTHVPITPKDCRERGLSYTTDLYYSVQLSVFPRTPKGSPLPDKFSSEIYPKVLISRIPIMIGSKYDTSVVGEENPFSARASMFIINGIEKVLIPPNRMRHNKVIVTKEVKANKTVYKAEIRSVADSGNGYSALINVYFDKRKNGVDQLFLVKLPYVSAKFDVATVLRALGVAEKDLIPYMTQGRTDKAILKLVQPTFTESESWEDPSFALYLIGFAAINVDDDSTKEAYIQKGHSTLQTHLFPHLANSDLPLPDQYKEKALFLGSMCYNILQVILGEKKLDERDHVCSKQYQHAGEILGLLYLDIFAQFRREFRNNVNKPKTESVSSILKSRKKFIQEVMVTALAKGQISTRSYKNTIKTGITAPVSRYSTASIISQATKANTPIPREVKLPKPRQLNHSYCNVVCPVETPEGAPIGLLLNLAITAQLTTYICPHYMMDLLNSCLEKPLLQCSFQDFSQGCFLQLNGKPLGIVKSPDVVHKLREFRRRGLIHYQTGIHINKQKNSIKISTDSGRLICPYLIVENTPKELVSQGVPPQRIKLTRQRLYEFIGKTHPRAGDNTLNPLVAEGYIEFLDVEESDNCNRCCLEDLIQKDSNGKWRNRSYTHCFIHQVSIFGVLAGCIPFSPHNPTTRATFQCAMAKAAPGVPSLDYDHRLDTFAMINMYPQKPLCTTKTATAFAVDDFPGGQELSIGILASENNQEDAVKINQGSVDRGVGITIYQRTFTETERAGDPNTFYQETFCKPGENVVGKKKENDYSKLDEDGIIPPGTRVKPGTVLVGKTGPYLSEKGDTTIKMQKCRSLCNKTEQGIVDKSIITNNADGLRIARVRIRSVRKARYGDKWSSRHGQKGVCGQLDAAENFPFCPVTGESMDMLISPNAVPSRMTLGQLYEQIAGNIAVRLGTTIDATPLDTSVINEDEMPFMEKIKWIMKKLGLNENGERMFIDGRTGKLLQGTVFTGFTFYQKLKHMAMDKVHARNGGPISTMHHQPIEGRSRDGGLKFGEMERDCILSHGSSGFIKHLFTDLSDRYTIYVCTSCEKLAYKMLGGQIKCSLCNTMNQNFVKVDIPYAAKLLFQVLEAMCISIRIKTTSGSSTQSKPKQKRKDEDDYERDDREYSKHIPEEAELVEFVKAAFKNDVLEQALESMRNLSESTNPKIEKLLTEARNSLVNVLPPKAVSKIHSKNPSDNGKQEESIELQSMDLHMESKKSKRSQPRKPKSSQKKTQVLEEGDLSSLFDM